jgi:outer membrane protein OmpA-like peptidoglycan-associated protein
MNLRCSFIASAQKTIKHLPAAAKVLALVGPIVSLLACQGSDPRPALVLAVPQSPVVAAAAPLPFDEAVISAANALFASAQLSDPAPSGRHQLIIDPLIDGVTGARSAATASMEERITALVHERHADRFDLQPISTDALARSPLVLLGSFTGVGPNGRTVGPPNAYRITLVLADLRSGRIVARGVARALPSGVDTTPAPFERDSPLWLASDDATRAYLRTCEGKVGEPVDPGYLNGVFASALIADALAAFDAGRQRDALDLFEAALRAPGGDQLRTYEGLYLANRALGRRAAAEEAFGQAVDFGLRHGRLAVKLVFRPGSTLFWPDPTVSDDYSMWLRQIASRVAAGPACLRLVGHTSAKGSPVVNDRLSLARAEYVRARLVEEVPSLASRTEADGRGSRELVLGTGRDDLTDLVDRRVEIEPVACEEMRRTSNRITG